MTEEAAVAAVSSPPSDAPSAGLEGALRVMGKSIADLAKTVEVDNGKAAKRALIMLFLMGAAVASLIVGTFGIIITARDVASTADRVESLAAKVEAIQDEQTSIRAATEDAAEKAAEVADSVPKVELVPATSASAGKPARPAGARVVFKQPGAGPSASSVSVPLALPSAAPVPPSVTASSSSGGL